MADINKIIEKYILDNIALSIKDDTNIDGQFEVVNEILEANGFNECFVSGSIGRKTSISPANDIDIICPIKGVTELNSFRFSEISEIDSIIRALQEYFGIEKVRLQTHSIGILIEGTEDGFSVDIVPAIQTDIKNKEKLYYLYDIPTNLLKKSHTDRQILYKNVEKGKESIIWEKTDPRGYIYEANQTDKINKNFRLGTLFLKKWRHFMKDETNKFIKSFHIEEYIKGVIKENKHLSLNDTIQSLEYINIGVSSIKNRANSDKEKNIDFYVNETDFLLCKSEIKLMIANFIVKFREINKIHKEDEVMLFLDRLFNKKEKLSTNASQPAVILNPPHFSGEVRKNEDIVLTKEERIFLKKNSLN